MKKIMYDEITMILKERLDNLNQQVRIIRKALNEGDTERLRISASANRKPRYFVRPYGDQSEFQTNDIDKAQKLAQLDYYHKILPILEMECRAINRALNTNSKEKIDQVYLRMNAHRQALVTPVILNCEQRREKFLSQSYITQPFEPEDKAFYSKSGLRVRSKSEGMIVDTLEEYDVPFRYAPQKIINSKTVYPDFECLNVRTGKEYFWEHNGMMTEVGYGHRFTRKVNFYESAGIYIGDKMIMTFEDDKTPLSYQIIRRTIERYLI